MDRLGQEDLYARRQEGQGGLAAAEAKWLREHLEERRQPAGLIVAKSDGQAFASGFARQAIRRTNDTCAVKGITPHRLRGTFATLMSEASVPIQTVQRVMRHKSVTTTIGYLEKNLDLAAQAQEHISLKVGLSKADFTGPCFGL